MRTKDITSMIERLEAFEDRLGVTLRGIYGRFDGSDFDNEYLIRVLGELHATDGVAIDQNIELVVVVYDRGGRVIGTDHTFFLEDEFFGFDTFDISVEIPTKDFAKLRIYPKPM